MNLVKMDNPNNIKKHVRIQMEIVSECRGIGIEAINTIRNLIAFVIGEIRLQLGLNLSMSSFIPGIVERILASDNAGKAYAL